MESKKHVFWQAFFVTTLFFLIGFVFGIYLEQMRSDDLSATFYQSETSLYDSLALGRLIGDNSTSCAELRKANIDFADKIYNEARELEKYDEKNKLTDSIKSVHRKYDLLRTLLWMNVIDLKKRCGNIDSIVYFYSYGTDSIEIKSKQAVFSNVLGDLKEKRGNDFVLIPIATNQDIQSLSYLLGAYNMGESPAILINEKVAIYELKTVSEIESYLK